MRKPKVHVDEQRNNRIALVVLCGRRNTPRMKTTTNPKTATCLSCLISHHKRNREHLAMHAEGNLFANYQ